MNTDNIKNKIMELRARMSQLRDAIRRVQTLQVPPEEIVQRVAETVSKSAIQWRGSAGSLLQGHGGAGSPTLSGSIELPWRISEPLPWGALCAGDPAHATAIVTALLEQEMSSPDYHPGPPSAERPTLLADLEAELREVDAAEVSLVDEAIECGLSIEHRTETAYRRERPAQERDRQKALDAAYNERLRGGVLR